MELYVHKYVFMCYIIFQVKSFEHVRTRKRPKFTDSPRSWSEPAARSVVKNTWDPKIREPIILAALIQVSNLVWLLWVEGSPRGVE